MLFSKSQTTNTVCVDLSYGFKGAIAFFRIRHLVQGYDIMSAQFQTLVHGIHFFFISIVQLPLLCCDAASTSSTVDCQFKS